MKNLFYTILIIACITSCKEDKNARVETRSATGITDTRATCWGKITEQGTIGISVYGIEIEYPEGWKMLKYTITEADSFGVQLTDLQKGTKYTYRAFLVENGSDGARVSSYKSFNTLVPVEFSVSFTNITDQVVDVEFTNTDLLRSWGLYWKAGSEATTSDTKVEAKGAQTITLEGLEPYTDYYILGYAIDKNGLEIFTDGYFQTDYSLP